MKKHALFPFWISVAMLLVAANPAQAGRMRVPMIFSWGGEKITKVADFPDTQDFKLRDGSHVDAGYRYKHISLFFIPVWNYAGQWCGYVGDSSRYLDIDKDRLDALANAAGLELPPAPRLPFWESCGGKLLLASLIGWFVISRRDRGKI